VAINSEKLELLQEFCHWYSDVEGSFSLSDGLPIAARLPSGMDEERTSAMSAAMLSLGERMESNCLQAQLSGSMLRELMVMES